MPNACRFSPPWTIEELNDACFIVRDKNGQALGFFFFAEEPGRPTAANLLTKDETRRMGVNFAKLPELLCGRVEKRGVTRLQPHFTKVRATSAYAPAPEVSPQCTI